MKIVILCFPRSGSTLLITALGASPGVRQGMEIFNPVLEGEAPYVGWRKRAMAELYGPRDSYLDANGYLDEGRLDLVPLARRFFADYDATKIMYDQLYPTSGVWGFVRALPDLRVIVLRRNIVEAAVSFRIAMETNVWHVTAGDAAPPPTRLAYEPGYIAWFYDHFCAPEARVVPLFSGHDPIEVDYRMLVTRWTETLAGLQRRLGLVPLAVAPPFAKGVTAPVDALIANYAEVRAFYARHPVLAEQFRDVDQATAAIPDAGG